ncbi:MAG TPA: GAF domain-containing sensor histidine kinase [Sporichthya sp.]|jgi:signal transduction histidine kinase|nr:GAF domain-containing sensor histidine kinase [Sporichthya sp.]
MELAERLTTLLEASLDLADERDPHELAVKSVAAACRLLDARYGALFIDDAGVLTDFVTWGIDEATAAAIGDPPTRTGLHGFLLKGGRTIRSDDLTTDSRATGFPRHHPVMHTFVGTPLRYRGRVLGELYLAEKQGGDTFTADDERVLEALAALAAAAYWNAQLLAAERQVAARATALLDARERGDGPQAVFRRLVWAEEEERARVARELHDGLGQILTSAALFAKGVEESVDGELAARVAVFRRLVERALVSARALVRGLRPLELDELGLLAALERLTADVRETHGLRVDLHGAPVPASRDVETAVYRIIQEALNNVVRHAGATWASVVVGRNAGRVVVIVEDDGRGFDRGALTTHGMRGEQLGLLGMKERAAAIGGELTVESEPGRGTLVRLEVPAEP